MQQYAEAPFHLEFKATVRLTNELERNEDDEDDDVAYLFFLRRYSVHAVFDWIGFKHHLFLFYLF